MATVRKRKLPSGLIRWQASYVDGAGKRRAKLFDRKSDGEAWLALNSLREWKLVCPKGDLGLVFPTGSGNVESHSNIVQRGFDPIQVAAGLTVPKPVLNDAGEPIINNAGQPVMKEVGKYGLQVTEISVLSV
jgi:hypothetical protein